LQSIWFSMLNGISNVFGRCSPFVDQFHLAWPNPEVFALIST
jgi:hypothetical protein